MKFKEYIKSKNKNLTECSRELGISLGAVHKYANRSRIPTLKNMQKIVSWSNGEVEPNDFYLNDKADHN